MRRSVPLFSRRLGLLIAVMGALFVPRQSDAFTLFPASSSARRNGRSRGRGDVVSCRMTRKPPTQQRFKHALAILSMPRNSMDRIANEVILESVLPRTEKLSVVLRACGPAPSLASLRRYVGEVYSQLWDCVMGDAARSALPDVIVYPQNLPNTAPESWIDIQPDLDCVCSHDSLTGWISECESDRGRRFENREGAGGLDEHVAALNSERSSRKLPPVAALKVTDKKWPADSPEVIFLDDELEEQEPCRPDYGPPASDWKRIVDDEPDNDLQLAGARLPANKKLLFDSVAVGGTFDGMHFGHRKLLTLAVSSVTPLTGKLLVGVTVDDMLTNKKYAEHIPCFEERCAGVRSFLDRLAPGMINRVHVTPITDSFGPPGTANQHFDALVLSHETLGTGHKLNQHRVEHLGLHPLKLLCTRRTEVHGMSSTALRKLKSQQQQWMETI